MSNTVVSPILARQELEDRFQKVESAPLTSTLEETLCRLGYLSPDQVETVKMRQSKKGAPFGKTAVSLRYLKHTELQYALGVQLGFLHERFGPISIPEALVIAHSPYSKRAEEYRNLRTRLVTSEASGKLSEFCIFGVTANSGAVDLAVNLAASLAQLGRSVLLVDANLRRPTLATMFGIDNIPGITNIVTKEISFEKSCTHTLVKNLDLLPAGAAVTDPQALLSHVDFKELLDQAREAYDNVIIVTDPFGSISDGEYIWSATKKVFVVARRNQARSDQVLKLRSVLRSADVEIIGAAMTG